jgi:hypothetical protein
MAEQKIAAAVGSAGGKGKKPKQPSSPPQSVEQAMVAAVITAQAEGITDQDEIRRRQLEARDKFLGK